MWTHTRQRDTDRTHADIGFGSTTCNAKVTRGKTRHAASSERRIIAHWNAVVITLGMIELIALIPLVEPPTHTRTTIGVRVCKMDHAN